MTQTITTIDLIRRSMMLINAIAAGEIPSDADLNDALLSLNEMIDSWVLKPLIAYPESVENFVLTPGQALYDWSLEASPVPKFSSKRPVWVNNATCIRQGISTPILIVTQDEYDAIPLKTTPSPIVDRLLYVADFPDGKVTLYPVPTEAVTLSINASRVIDGPINLQAQLIMPPGYLRALRYNLAVELWPEYTNGTTDINSIKRIAAESLANVKRANIETGAVRFDEIPGVDDYAGWNWRIG